MDADTREPEWVFIRVRAESEEQLESYIGTLWKIVECTGAGYVGMFDEDSPPGELEVDLCSARASSEELNQIWDRVRAGEDVLFAWTAVQGPSFSAQRCRRLMGNLIPGLRPIYPVKESNDGTGE